MEQNSWRPSREDEAEGRAGGNLGWKPLDGPVVLVHS